jgi:hypothetical protein
MSLRASPSGLGAYTIERLQVLTGTAWLAGAMSLLGFTLVHLPLWGIGVSLTTFVWGAFSQHSTFGTETYRS